MKDIFQIINNIVIFISSKIGLEEIFYIENNYFRPEMFLRQLKCDYCIYFSIEIQLLKYSKQENRANLQESEEP